MSVIDIDQLKTFLAVVDGGSFTAASEIVHKTQSAVSMQMKKLEDQLQKKLFIKEGRTSKLSTDGERLVFYARRAVTLNHETLAAFDDNALDGAIRLGSSDDYAERFLPEILVKFSESNPLVEITVDCEGSNILDKMIDQNKLDIAIVTGSAVKNRCEIIRREPMHWVTSANHETHLNKKLPMVLDCGKCSWRQMALDALNDMNREYTIRYSSTSAVAIGSAVTAGLAVAIMPESAIRRGMRILSEADGFPALPSIEIGFIKNQKTTTTPASLALIEHIKTSLNNLMDQQQNVA